MVTPFDDAYARVIVEHSLDVRPGQRVLVEGAEGCVSLARAIAWRVREAGAVPIVRIAPDDLAELRGTYASDEVLGEADPLGLLLNREVDARVALLAESNLRALGHLPAERAALASRSRARTSEPLHARAARGEARWVVAQVPLESYAEAAGLSFEEYRALLVRGLRLEDADPIASWRRVGERQAALVELLERGDELRLVAPGTDLRVRVGGRRWLSSYGLRNLPDGEVFTGPHETSAEGVITFGLPTTYGGRRVEGTRLRFEAGLCVEAASETGGDVLQAALAVDAGARRLGEVALGLNRGIDVPTCDILLSEKIGGTAHLALGRSYPETGGSNVSDIHWDLVCDLRAGGEVYLDGRLIQRDGRFPPELGIDL